MDSLSGLRCNSSLESTIGEQSMKKTREIQSLSNGTYDEINSSIGKLTIITSPEGLHAILWDIDCNSMRYEKMIRNLTQSKNEKTIIKTKKQLTEYFQNKRKIFDLPLVINGTDFQIEAWKQL